MRVGDGVTLVYVVDVNAGGANMLDCKSCVVMEGCGAALLVVESVDANLVGCWDGVNGESFGSGAL